MWQTRFGRCIHTSPSGYKVYQNCWYRWLHLGSSALQTVINRRKPQVPVLYYVPALTMMAKAMPGELCMLGLGGAGVAHFLASSGTPYKITAVESDSEVIAIAQRFFMTGSIPNLKVLNQNGQDYVRDATEQFSHLIIDLYDAHIFPPECANEEFFIHCKQRLASNGFMAVNLANVREQWPLVQLIKKNFKNTLVIPVKHCANLVVFASEHEQSMEFISYMKQCKTIKNITLVSNWGYVGTL